MIIFISLIFISLCNGNIYKLSTLLMPIITYLVFPELMDINLLLLCTYSQTIHAEILFLFVMILMTMLASDSSDGARLTYRSVHTFYPTLYSSCSRSVQMMPCYSCYREVSLNDIIIILYVNFASNLSELPKVIFHLVTIYFTKNTNG